jgi:hypothetical protein
MKNKLYIIAFVILLLTSGGIAFFVKKQLDKKREAKVPEELKKSTEDLEVTIEEPVSPKPRELEKPIQVLNVESDIDAEVDTTARSIAYNMHYNGIATNGVFKDGGKDLLITKSFGSFSVKQAAPKATLVSTKGGNMSGKTGAISDVITKGEAALIKIGNTVIDKETNKSVAVLKSSDLVYLVIKDQHGVLRTLTVNLSTGEKLGSILPRNWDGN